MIENVIVQVQWKGKRPVWEWSVVVGQTLIASGESGIKSVALIKAATAFLEWEITNDR